MSVLADLTEVVMEELSDQHDEPYEAEAARLIAASLLAGLMNRGWEFRKSVTTNITLTAPGPAPFAGTIEQVLAIFDGKVQP